MKYPIQKRKTFRFTSPRAGAKGTLKADAVYIRLTSRSFNTATAAANPADAKRTFRTFPLALADSKAAEENFLEC